MPNFSRTLLLENLWVYLMPIAVTYAVEVHPNTNREIPKKINICNIYFHSR